MLSKLCEIFILCLVFRVPCVLTRTSSNVVFLLDDTVSMTAEIEGVKKTVYQLFNSVINSKKSRVGDFILVTFNDNERFDWKLRKFYTHGTIDEAINVRETTRDPAKFHSALSKIKVDGGGRCPEPALAGIKRAIEVASSNSYIYVFTDASAKDYDLADNVVAMAQNKSIQITFLLTGNCRSKENSKELIVYNKVANKTNGEVFNIYKDDVKKVIDYIIRCIESPTVTLQKTIVKPGVQKISIKVDGDMDSLMLSVSVTKDKLVTVEMTDPGGNKAYTINILDEKNSKVILVPNPQDGTYEVTVDTDGNGVATVKAAISIDFTYGFNETQVFTIAHTCTRPFAGHNSYLYIMLEDPNGTNARLKNVLIYDMNDKLLNTLSVTLIDKQENLYVTPLFKPPDVTFKITITVLNTKDGTEIKRNSATPITPQTLPSGFPVIDKQKSKIAAKEGSQTTIPCRILEGTPTPSMTWEFKKHDETDFVTLSENKEEISIPSVDLANVGVYRCHAKNAVGETYHDIELEMQRVPQIDKSKSNIIVKDGDTAIVPCRIIKGIPEPEIAWEFKGNDMNDFASIAEKGQEVKINPANLGHAGVYRCSAKNVVGNDVHETTMTVQCLPKIDKSESKRTAKKGDRVLISCRITQGIPKPDIRWEFKRKGASDFFNILGTDQELVINSVDIDNAGHYRCFAKNIIGEDLHDTELIVKYAPQIDKSKSNIDVKEGNTVTIPCRIIKGFPQPELFWEFKGKDMNDFASIAEKGQEITYNSADLGHAGVYRCSTKNLIGNDVHEITLTVQCLPKIDKSENKRTAKKGEKAQISCRITQGVPKPEIRWEFKRKGESDYFNIPETDQEFFIGPVDADNAGHYRCFAKNVIGEDMHDTELIVQYAPQIDKSKSNIKVKEGNTATIPCRIIKGFPQPDLFWEFKGNDMNNFASIAEKGQEIIYNSANLGHAGVYRCSAKNLIGNDVHEVTLTVQCLPKIDKSENKKTAKKGEKAKISCRITQGIPKPEIRWEFKRKDASDFFSIPGTDQEFLIDPVDIDNAGHYRCFAKNIIGEDVHDTELNLQYKPQIDKSKSNVKVQEGDTAIIPCSIIGGAPKPEVFWEFKGKDTSNFVSIPEKGQEIHINPASSVNAGVFRCSAKNLVGNDVHEISLTIESLPKIDKSETEKRVKKGEKTLISCRIIQGSPKPDIRWEFKRKDASDFYSIPGTDEKFLINSADVDNAGHYKCFAKNQIGEDVHDTELIVQYVPQIDKSKTNIKITEGDTATIPCRIIGGVPEPEVFWEFKEKDTTNFASISEKGQEIHINPVNLGHAGVYRCSAKNLIGTDVHETTLTVQCLPKIDKSESKTTARKGDKKIISCRITKSIPTAEIRWEFKMKGASDFFSIPGTDQEFVIAPVNINNAGHYRCLAKNEIGEDVHDTELIVQYAPEIDKTNTIETVLEGSEATITCKIVQSLPEAWITWESKRKGKFVGMSQTGETLHIKAAASQDSGTYKCTAKNLVGKDVHEIELKVQFPPQIERTPSTTVVKQGSKAIIPCRIIRGVPDPTITWEFKRNGSKNFYRILTTSQEFINIQSADLQSAGVYRCHANNGVGEDTLDTELIVHYPPLIFKGKRRETAVIGSKAVLSCSITRGTPEPLITWEFKQTLAGTYMKPAETQKDINIDAKDVDNAGFYKCVAENYVGVDTHEIELIIEYAPTVDIKQPDVVKVGDDVTLSCNAEGVPDPRVKWLRNNVIITQNNKFNIDKNHDLRFTADLNDRGNITCEARNIHGSDAMNATLQVYEPVTIDTTNGNPTVDVGSDLDLVCDARGDPKPKIEWFFYSFTASDGVVLPSTDKIFHIKRIQLTDSGTYYCTADNQYSSADFDYTVYVNVPVEIEPPKQKDFYFVENDLIVRIPCKATGSPEPAILWTKDGTTLTMDNYFYQMDNDGTLMILNPTQASEGHYSCNAYQAHRTPRAVKTFTVQRKPILSPNDKVDTELVEEHLSYKVQCKVPHQPKDIIHWYKNGVEIPTGSRSQYALRQVSESDAGTYTCRVNSALGSESAHTKIVVGAKPLFWHPQKVAAVVPYVYNDRITLECEATGKPPPKVKWYHNDKLTPVNTFTHTFDERETDKGIRRCDVTNDFGTITKTFEIKLTGCFIDYNTLIPNQHHPLLLTRKRKLNAFENQNGKLTVPQKEIIDIACPKEVKNVQCLDNEFIDHVDHRHYKYTDLMCDNEMNPDASRISLPGQGCALDKDSKLIEVGFQVLTSFSVVYDVCFDSQKKLPIFIHNTLNRFASEVELDSHRKPPFRKDYVNAALDDFYDSSNCYKQANTFGPGCCFVRKQLVTPQDVPPGVENATYFSVNVVPQWNYCGKNNNWDEVERRIRKLAKKVAYNLKIYSGGLHYETRDVYVGGYNVKIETPKFIWKVVQVDERSVALAIVIINIPNLSEAEAKNLVFCNDICYFTDWMTNNDWHKVENGYVFCCAATDFASKVNKYYKNIFHAGVLYDSDAIT